MWDGGNNDVPFFKPDLHITLVDSLRPLDETAYYPGETNVRMADMIVIAKVNQLSNMKYAEEHAARLRKIAKPDATIVFGSSIVTPEAKNDKGDVLSEREAIDLVKGKRVLVVDDGPTLTHGGMAYGAGYVLAKKFEAAEIVNPRPHAQGALKAVFEKFTHLKNVLPAMGYGETQVRDLEATINAAECDTVVLGTPFDISRILKLNKPTVIARYELEFELPDHEHIFKHKLDETLNMYAHGHAHHAA